MPLRRQQGQKKERTMKELQETVRVTNQFIMSGRKTGNIMGMGQMSQKSAQDMGLEAAAELRKRRRKKGRK